MNMLHGLCKAALNKQNFPRGAWMNHHVSVVKRWENARNARRSDLDKSQERVVQRVRWEVLAGQPRLRLLLALMPFWPAVALAYPADVHQEMTFLAARLLNQCLIADGQEPVSALQVRHIARANTQMADRSAFVRMFRWNYYASVPGTGRTLFGLVDTRFEGHFEELAAAFGTGGEDRSTLRKLGRMVFYLQRMTTPHRVVPVFSERFWRLSFADRFDDWPLDHESVATGAAGHCDTLLASNPTPQALLQTVVADTVDAVRSPISGLPVTWEAIWQMPAQAGAFGEYGVAGNRFGEEVEFDCEASEPCVLLRHDPLYRDFAVARHTMAIRATMQALMWLRRPAAAGEDLEVPMTESSATPEGDLPGAE
jgi:hypothetical protein